MIEKYKKIAKHIEDVVTGILGSSLFTITMIEELLHVAVVALVGGVAGVLGKQITKRLFNDKETKESP